MKRSLIKYVRPFWRSQDGATAVEFGIVFPILVMMLFGIIHTGIFFWGVHQAQRDSETVAREARLMDMPSQADILTLITNTMDTPIAGTYTPVVTIVSQHGAQFADIRINYSYNFPVPFMKNLSFSSQAGTRVLLRTMPST